MHHLIWPWLVHSIRMRAPQALMALALSAALCGCADLRPGASVGIGVPIFPGVSVGIGLGTGGIGVGVNAGSGPVGVGVGVNGAGQVTGHAGVGVRTPGPVSVGAGVGVGKVLYDPHKPPAKTQPQPAQADEKKQSVMSWNAFTPSHTCNRSSCICSICSCSINTWPRQ
jgi:hypothetical protein